MTTISKYFASIGRTGGLKSRRALDSVTARRMVQIREARRAFRRFHTECFWSYSPDLVVGADGIVWVAEELQKHGGVEAWHVASRLCR